jgi:hypothetical protein
MISVLEYSGTENSSRLGTKERKKKGERKKKKMQ